jgi:hypothetical protein
MASVGDADGVKPSGVLLEQRCRRLLLAYPRDYRAERGDEIVSTMLDAMPAGRRWPDPADAADVVAGGLRHRLGTASLVGFDEGLALAAPVALSLAAGIAGFAWWRVEPVTAGAMIGGEPLFGLFRTLGPVAYAFWLLSALGWAVLRPAPSRVLIAVSIAVTLALPVVAPLTGVDRPPLWVMLALSVFGLLALVGSAPASGGYRSTLDGRLSVPAGAVAITVAASTVVTLWAPAGEAYGYYYQPTIARVGTVVTATVAIVAAIAIARQVRRRGAGGWLWAAALLGLPAGWMGPFDSDSLRTAATDATPHFGRLAQVVLASCVAVTTIAWLARRGRPTTSGDLASRNIQARVVARMAAPLGRAAAVALGALAGLGAFLGLARAGWLGFAREPSSLPVHVLVAIGLLAVAGLAAAVVARPAPRVIAVSAGLALGLAWLVAVYDNRWSVAGWADLGHTTSLVITLVLVPLSLCLDAAVRSLAAPDLRTRAAALVVAAASLGWLGYAALPYVLSWGPVLFVLVICIVAVALSRRPRSRRS